MGDLSLFKNGAEIPDYLLSKDDNSLNKSLAGGGSIKRISIGGGAFRMMVGSQELAVNDSRAMNFVVVGAAPAIARTYHSTAYTKDADTPPDCYSDDGVVPSEQAYKPQHARCADCPMNVKGSGQGDTRACRFHMRLAVALEGDVSGGVYAISLPSMSIFGKSNGRMSPMQEYARKLDMHRVSVDRVVTEFRFDLTADVPKLLFQAVRPLSRDEIEEVKALQSEDLTPFIGPRTFSRKADAAPLEPLYALPQTPETSLDDDEDEDEPAPPPPKAAEDSPKKRGRPSAAPPTKVAELEDVLAEWTDD